MYKIYKLPQGQIVINVSNKDLSTGILFLNPHQELPKHKRPIAEQLIQLVGTCILKLFEEDKVIQEIILHENETLTIPANQFHKHINSTRNFSVTMWKFEGDVTEVIQKIRDDNEKAL